MSNTPNMGLVQPVPGSDAGVWGQELNTSLNTVDAHDHSSGKGVKVPVAGLNIDADLDFNANRAIDLNSVQVKSLSGALTGGSSANSFQSVNGDMYWTNGAGTAVQVTSGNAIASTSSTNTPAGIVLPFAGTSAPAGYLLADGTAVSRTTYATLFGAIGTTYGVGDGSTTFNVPDLKGRVPVGAGTYTDPILGSTTRSLAAKAGEASHVLSTAEMPSHSHTDSGHTHPVPANTGSGTPGAGAVDADISGPLTSGTGFANIQNTGGGGSHNNMQPYLVLNYIIKT